MYENFNEEIYKERFKIERTFAWQDTYRKLVIRYEKLECTHLGFKHLAYTMINLRQMLNGGNLI
jgi:transposase